MAFSLDPRGDLILPDIKPTRAYRPINSSRDNRRSQPLNHLPKQKSQPRPCHDWIFSTASNVHIAIDRSSFKTYTDFNSYVLTLSDRRQIPVKGIGSVDINLRRAQNSSKSHTVTLHGVLHVPSWVCNIFSDTYFLGLPFEHTWTSQGIQFMQRTANGNLEKWAFTADFFGLERFSVAGATNGRSPMMEDKEREIFSVNVIWPQGQLDKWDSISGSH